MKILCVLGEYQYGEQARGRGTEFDAFLPALRRLGHEVVHFESWDRSRFKDFAELNGALLQTVERERPAVLLAVQFHYELWTETLRIIQLRGDVAAICWTTDDSWRYASFSRHIGPYYHAMTTTYENCVKRYYGDGIEHVLLTQWAANADWFREPLPADQCKYKVSFIGAAHGNRKERVERLRASGIDVVCFGHGWPNGPLSTEKVIQTIRESMICLNFANTPGIGMGPPQIKARTFEVPAAGGFLLSEYGPGIERVYAADREIATFQNNDELAAKIKFFLAHPSERDAIARAGHERTRREHTYDLRMKAVVEFAVKAQEAWLKKHGATPAPDFEAVCLRHTPGVLSKAYRGILKAGCRLAWGDAQGTRMARALTYRLSTCCAGAKTYSSAGWPGKLFPEL